MILIATYLLYRYQFVHVIHIRCENRTFVVEYFGVANPAMYPLLDLRIILLKINLSLNSWLADSLDIKG